MAQLLHACSTGFLVVLSPPAVSPGQEALWYVGYAGVLWLVAIAVVALKGSTLTGTRPTAATRRMAKPPATAGS